MIRMAMPALVLLACGGEPPVGAPLAPDATAAILTDGGAHAPFEIAAGVGEPGAFAIPPTDTPLLLQRGCQGAQHIFVALRTATRPGEAFVGVAVVVRRVADGAVVSTPFAVTLPWELDPLAAGAGRVTGLTPVIEVPRDILEQEAEVEVTATTATATASSRFRGLVRWGADSCGGH